MITVFDDYLVPLMRILDRLSQHTGKSEYVITIFEKTYGKEIAPHQFTLNSSGRIRWIHSVRWARETLKGMGFLDAPSHGIWRLTEAGHQWLVENPNSNRIRENRKTTFSQSTMIHQIHNLGEEFQVIRSEISSCADFQGVLEKKIKKILGEHLSKYRIHCRNKNCIQIHFDDFGGCHYEMSYRPSHFDIALHFESTAQKCLERIKVFDPYLYQFEQNIGEKINSGPLESRGWMRLWLEKPNPSVHAKFSETDVENYTNLMVYLIRETYPILENMYHSENVGKKFRKTIPASVPSNKTSQEFTNIHREIETIHNFLQGRIVSKPNDEKLCDWINFCYLIGLYREGRELFTFVSQENTHPWYYEKMKKLAHLCELKSSK